MIDVRPLDPLDERGLTLLLDAAFGGDAESRIVNGLRADESAWIPELSLGAFDDAQLVGYALLSRVGVGEQGRPALALGPVAVAPHRQREGIGARLTQELLSRAAAMGEGAAIVLGHPGFYGPLGFVPAAERGIAAPWDVPSDAWMAAELAPGALQRLHGVVRYPRAWDIAFPELHAVVVGGANTDIVGHSYAALVQRDSNPGFVRISAGGVGRNVAENLARLRVSTHLVSAFGGDHNAAALAEQCEAVGIGLEHALHIDSLPGSLYIAILDQGGDMAIALNDMRALEHLDVAHLERHAAVFADAHAVVLDANLPPDTLHWLAHNVSAPLVLDPVSAAKAGRCVPILGRLAAVKCNAMEAAVLLGVEEPADEDGFARLAAGLVAAGAGAAYVTAGRAGVFYCDATASGHAAAPHGAIANATGAGDAFTAGVVAGMLWGWDVARCAAHGSAMAGLTLASEHTVSDLVTPESARERMEEAAT